MRKYIHVDRIKRDRIRKSGPEEMECMPTGLDCVSVQLLRRAIIYEIEDRLMEIFLYTAVDAFGLNSPAVCNDLVSGLIIT